jgi:hypothetical protein
MKINNLDTYCEQVGRRGKDYETKLRIHVVKESYEFVLQNVFYMSLFLLKNNVEFGEDLEIPGRVKLCSRTLLSIGEEKKKMEWHCCRKYK